MSAAVPAVTKDLGLSSTDLQVVQGDALVQQLATVKSQAPSFSAYSDALQTDEERRQADAMAEAFQPTKIGVEVDTYGAQVQRQIGDETKPILEKVRMRDTGIASGALESFLKEVDGIDFDSALRTPDAFTRFFMKIFKSLDPFVAWLKSLSTLETIIQSQEARLQKASDLMIERANWFASKSAKMAELYPNLYLYAAACEKVLARNEQILANMEEEATTSKDPAMTVKVNRQRDLVTVLKARVLDLHESAITSLLMIPISDQSERAALIVNGGVLKALNSTIAKIRLTLSVLINQRDIQEVARTAAAVEDLDNALLKKLGASLGATNTAVETTLQKRKDKVEAIRGLVDDLKAQLQRAKEINDAFGETYTQALTSYGEITESVRTMNAT
jgi:uncharacterized protein YaaN involved in tellurite resistance